MRNPAGDAAVLTVTPRHGPQDDATRALVDRLRDDVIPATGAEAYVGGRTARFGDEAERIASRIPLFAAAVVGMSLLLLLAAFRSWRIALLSAVFNLASIAAAYGVVVLAFQTATGAGLLGVEQLPVVPYVPLFMFAILFGLSTDYNVFLLSRVREEWDRHADHRAAIAAASAGTRRIITAAGGVMVAVFLGFATDPDPVIKMTGVGLATAVLVDVTLVRLLMAPAALSLLGDRLWPDRRAGAAARRRRASVRRRDARPRDRDALRRPRLDRHGRAGDDLRRRARRLSAGRSPPSWPGSPSPSVNVAHATRAEARRGARRGARQRPRSPDVAGAAGRVVSVVPAAAHQAGERGDPAAEHEARDGGADQHLLAVLVELLAPVGDLGHLGAQALDGDAELGAVGLDRAPDLLRRCATSAISAPPPPAPGGRRRRPSASPPGRRSAWP